MEISVIWNQPKCIHQEYYDEHHTEIMNLFHKIESASSQMNQLYLNFRAILREINPTYIRSTEQRFLCRSVRIY